MGMAQPNLAPTGPLLAVVSAPRPTAGETIAVQYELPLDFTVPAGGFGGDCFLRTSKGTKIKRWGSVAQACKILGGCGRQSIYDLVHAGLITAYKLKPWRSNSHWRIDLVTVQEWRNNQMRCGHE